VALAARPEACRQPIPVWRFPATFAAKACHFCSISGYYRRSFLTIIHARENFRHRHSDSVRHCATGITAGVSACGAWRANLTGVPPADAWPRFNNDIFQGVSAWIFAKLKS
jgi:hypothetical protein